MRNPKAPAWHPEDCNMACCRIPDPKLCRVNGEAGHAFICGDCGTAALESEDA